MLRFITIFLRSFLEVSTKEKKSNKNPGNTTCIVTFCYRIHIEGFIGCVQ